MSQIPTDRSDLFTGNQLRDGLLLWRSPPDPSSNYNITRHDRTTEWWLVYLISGNAHIHFYGYMEKRALLSTRIISSTPKL